MEHACHTFAGALSTCIGEEKVFIEAASSSILLIVPALAQGVHAGCIFAGVDGLQTPSEGDKSIAHCHYVGRAFGTTGDDAAHAVAGAIPEDAAPVALHGAPGARVLC